MSPNMIEMDERQLYNQVVASMERELGEVLNPGDERRITAGAILSAIVAITNQGNAFARAQCLSESYGEQLVALGEFVGGILPLPASPANVAIRFTVTAPTGYTGEIPAGTLVTADGQRFFETKETLFFSWDSEPLTTTACATQGGSAYNGYPTGTINTIVRPLPYLKVTNTSPSVGGTDIEDDDSYRNRIRMAPSSFSSAGPKAGYQFFALSADGQIGDVSVTSPAPRQVEVTVLLKGGGIPPQAILDKVTAVLSADDVRPITDLVTVKAATAQSYTVAATYYIAAEDAVDELQIKAAVERAYEEYLLWQRDKLGRAINPDRLRQMVLGAGANRIDVPGLAYTVVPTDKVAVATEESTLVYGGLLA